MPSLADVQTSIRIAMVTRETRALTPLLVGGRRPDRRLAIHTRHYETSLVTALLLRFPATVWLMGSTFVVDAARDFIRAHPPTRPCIAEYGHDFPQRLATRAAATVPYLRAFAELEYAVGAASLGVPDPPLELQCLSHIAAQDLPDVTLGLQSALRYQHTTWAVDRLLSVYLESSTPASFELPDAPVWLEILGARGEVQVARLTTGAFAFRTRIADRHTLGDAAAHALAVDSAFEPGPALADLFASGLVTAWY